MISNQDKIGGISTYEGGMKSTGSRMKIKTKFLVVFGTLPDYRGVPVWSRRLRNLRFIYITSSVGGRNLGIPVPQFRLPLVCPCGSVALTFPHITTSHRTYQ